jgi:hypothetical protein
MAANAISAHADALKAFPVNRVTSTICFATYSRLSHTASAVAYWLVVGVLRFSTNPNVGNGWKAAIPRG